jgi:hypothetical protein
LDNAFAGLVGLFLDDVSAITKLSELHLDSLQALERGALSSDGSTALVGAPSSSPKGLAYVFTRSGTNWTPQGPPLQATTPMTVGDFGSSVALSSDGNTALVAAYLAGATDSAYVFTRSGATSWSPPLELPVSAIGFGLSVALSGDGNTALVGAGNTMLAGSAYVFAHSGTMWSQQGTKLQAPVPTTNDNFGISVALSSDGNTALVGASNENGYTGAAYAFTRLGTNWSSPTPLAETASDLPATDDFFGISVALSSDGNTALVGAQGKAAYVFTWSGTNWSQQGPGLTAAPEANGAGFAQSVALSSDANTALVGAYDNAVCRKTLILFARRRCPECGRSGRIFSGVLLVIWTSFD